MGRPRIFDHDAAIKLFATGDYTITGLARELGIEYATLEAAIRKKAPHLKKGRGNYQRMAA